MAWSAKRRDPRLNLAQLNWFQVEIVYFTGVLAIPSFHIRVKGVSEDLVLDFRW